MSSENPRNLIRSWTLQSAWATGPTVEDKLTPPDYGRIRTPFVHTWREQTLDNNLDWGTNRYSIYLPESLRVVSSMFLKIDVSENSSISASATADFKKYPGLYAMREFKLLSAGQEVYTCNVQDFLVDYMESLTDEQLKRFSETYLGHQQTIGSGARTILIPLLMPNSAYLGRAGGSRGHGIFPCFLGQNRAEIQISMNEANHLSSSTAQQPASIAGSCSLVYHQVEMTSNNILRYSDLRGAYSLVGRRFTELTSGYQSASANTEVVIKNQQPQGTVTEIMVIAVPAAQATDDRIDRTTQVLPSQITVTADSIDQKVLDADYKIKAELWTNGFVPPTDFPSPGRCCFAAHASEATHQYSGGYNMTLASNVHFKIKFKQAVRFRVVAVQLQRTKIDSLGIIRSYLE